VQFLPAALAFSQQVFSAASAIAATSANAKTLEIKVLNSFILKSFSDDLVFLPAPVGQFSTATSPAVEQLGSERILTGVGRLSTGIYSAKTVEMLTPHRAKNASL